MNITRETEKNPTILNVQLYLSVANYYNTQQLTTVCKDYIS